MYSFSAYQLDFTTPGRLPRRASRRKQIRHNPNLRMYPRGRPHILQRLRTLTVYLRLDSRATIDFFATEFSPAAYLLPGRPLYDRRNGMSISASIRRASSSVSAVVTIVISSPRTLSIES